MNNAVLAGRHSKPLLETEPEDWDAMMAVNLRGPYLLCRAAVRQMLTQPLVGDVRGRIVNITSQHGMVGCPGHFAYSVGKGGLVQMTRQIAVDYGPHGHPLQRRRAGQDRDGHARRPQRRARRAWPTSGRARRSRAWDGPRMSPRPSPTWRREASYTSGINLMVDGGWMAY